MKLLAFAVFDRAARAYFPPVYQSTRGLGERWFSDILMNAESLFAKHPGDMELFEVGFFDSETGELVGRSPELLTTGVQTLSLRQVSNG